MEAPFYNGMRKRSKCARWQFSRCGPPGAFLPARFCFTSNFCAKLALGVIMPDMPLKQVPLVRPQPSEYASYYEKYVSLIPGTDVLGVLEAQQMLMTQLLAARSEREGNFRYAPDKWTVKELVGHISDTERVFTYRACASPVPTALQWKDLSRTITLRMAGSTTGR